VIPYTPSLIRTRSFNIALNLARRGHAVTLAAPWETAEDLENQRRLSEEGIKILTARLTRSNVARNLLGAAARDGPLQAAYSWSEDLFRQIAQALAVAPSPDAIHLEHLRSACYGMALASLPSAGTGIPPVVWDSVDCISLLFERTLRFNRSALRRVIALLELPRTRRWEGRLVRRFSRVLATSQEDADALERLTRPGGTGPSPSVTVIPNGVDLDFFAPGEAAREAEEILLTGKMSYHANVAAAVQLVRVIMPLVWASHPKVRVVLAGKSPTREVRDLERIRPGFVTVTGTVPDLRPYLRRATAAVTPLVYGVGVQNKVLEAMACATPVIATPQAASPFTVASGQEIMIAETPEAFSAAILKVLGDEPLRRRLGHNGRRYVEQHHDWGAMAGRLEEVYAAARRSSAMAVGEGTSGA